MSNQEQACTQPLQGVQRDPWDLTLVAMALVGNCRPLLQWKECMGQQFLVQLHLVCDALHTLSHLFSVSTIFSFCVTVISQASNFLCPFLLCSTALTLSPCAFPSSSSPFSTFFSPLGFAHLSPSELSDLYAGLNAKTEATKIKMPVLTFTSDIQCHLATLDQECSPGTYKNATKQS